MNKIGKKIFLKKKKGMIIDLSHVSPDTMRQSIELSKAPVIFSHSNAYNITRHVRNVPGK
jgi:membrane dipeptidase